MNDREHLRLALLQLLDVLTDQAARLEDDVRDVRLMAARVRAQLAELDAGQPEE